MDLVTTKVLTMVLLASGSLILGLIPLKIRRFMGWSEGGKHSRRKDVITSILLCFGAGVLLATSFIHMLPEVRDGILHSGLSLGRLPAAEFFFCCGFFLIYLIEEIVHATFPSPPEAELRAALKRLSSVRDSIRRGAEMAKHAVTKFGPRDETGRDENEQNESELQNVQDQIASIDEVDIETSPTGNGIEETQDGQLSGQETPVTGSYNPKYRVRLNQSVHRMFPNYYPPDKKNRGRKKTWSCAESTLCSFSLRDFVTIVALSFHSIFEGLAVGLETTNEDVWQLFGAIATHKFVIAFCVGLELATNDTKLGSFIAYMVTFSLASPLGIAIGIAVTEVALIESPSSHYLTVSALQGISGGTILYVVIFEILHREKTKSVSGLLQLAFVIIGFVVMVSIEIFAGHLHAHGLADGHSNNCSVVDVLGEHLHSHGADSVDSDLGSFVKQATESDTVADHFHESHFKDHHGSHVPEQDIPPPLLNKASNRVTEDSKNIFKSH